MDSNTFTRSNVNERTLAIQSIDRSSFDLSHINSTCLPIGKLVPVNITHLMPNDTLQGGINPQLQLDKIATPRIGRLRLDTHTFFVNARRINRDFRKFVEQASDGSKASTIRRPSFNPADLFNQFFSMLNELSGYNNQEDPSAPVLPFWTHYWGSVSRFEYVSPLYKVAHRLSKCLYSYIETKAQADNSGFTLDVLKEYADSLASVSVQATQMQMDYVLYCQILDDFVRLFEYFFGVHSTFDYVKYPILHQFTPFFASAKAILNPETFTFRDARGQVISQYDVPWHDVYYSVFANLQSAFTSLHEVFTAGPVARVDFDYDMGSGLPDWNTVHLVWSDDATPRLSEDPFRYLYACYYDHFREFHMERHDTVLNPDDWSSTPLLNIRALGTAEQRELDFFTVLQLITLRQRYFSRDFLMTVQHDNIYRHVYAPIYNEVTGQVDISTDLSHEYDNITSIVNDTFNTIFPKGLFSHSSIMDDTKEVLRQDLQTMRRTHMLETFLAHNYYYSDTFAGQIEGHWQIKPNDVGILQAQYLGGSESFITGDQQINNTTTEYMDAGTRTMVANVSSDDNFTYSVGGEFGAVVSFASLVPMVTYDCIDMMARDLEVQDLPFPEFATDTRVQIKLSDMLRNFYGTNEILGYVPRYYGYRTQGDEVHGRFLTDWRSYNWLRDWYSMPYNLTDDGQHGFRLSPYCMRVRVSTDAFIGVLPWQPICYGDIMVKMFVNRPLPAAVEFV